MSYSSKYPLAFRRLHHFKATQSSQRFLMCPIINCTLMFIYFARKYFYILMN